MAVYFGVNARSEKEDKKRENYGLIGMCMGMCIGVSLKGIIGSVGIGISIGMLAGLVICSLIEKLFIEQYGIRKQNFEWKRRRE